MTIDLALPIHPTALHPLTGIPIRALGRRADGRLIWPAMGGDENAGNGGGSGASGSGSGDGGSGGGTGGSSGSGGANGSSGTGGSGSGDGGEDLGFPKDTPVAEMTDKQQAAYWRHQSKRHESRATGLSKLTGGKTAEEIRAEQQELEGFRNASRTDSERAAKEAADKARSEERASYGSKLVAAEFRAALAHVDADRRASIIEGLNLAAYLDEHGDVDTDKVTKYAETIAPAGTANQHQQRRDFGGGQRREGQAERGAAGRAMAEKRFGKQRTSTTT